MLMPWRHRVRQPSAFRVDGPHELGDDDVDPAAAAMACTDPGESTMRLALMSEPQQGLAYGELLALARTAEAAGLEAFFRSDHYASFPGDANRPTMDAWATLAGLARETERIRLGVLVSPVTFRLPGPLAKMATTVDEMSGGRLEVGLGAGWNELEHAQLGIPYPGTRERFDRLEEALAIVNGLWTEPDGWTYDGRFWQVRDAFYRPSPAREGRPRPNLIVGGEGKPRGLRLAARYADEYNVSSVDAAGAAAARAGLSRACADLGRDPDRVVFSAMVGVLVGETETEVQDRTRSLLTDIGAEADPAAAAAYLASRRSRWIIGTPEQALEAIEVFAAAGVRRLMLQDLLPRDLAMVRLIGERLLAPGSRI